MTTQVTDGGMRVGGMAAHVAAPEIARGSGVLVFMEAFGLNAHIHDVTRRLARAGHVALAPDLYHRQGEGIVGDYEDPSAIMGAFGRLTPDALTEDIAAAHAALLAQPSVEAGRVGAIGFCLGGYVAFQAATRDDVAAAACFYGAGTGLPRPGSPLPPLVERAGAIDGRVLLAYGEDDPHVPEDERATVTGALVEAGVEHDVHVYEGAGHGFFCDARSAHVPDAAADAWRRVVELFERL